jgi:hypothetical protein
VKKQLLLIFSTSFLVLFFACKDENLAPIATFDAAEKGAYVRLISQDNGNVNLFDIDNSKISYTIEFVDIEKGSLVSEYALNLEYEDNDPSNGDNSAGPIELRTYKPSDFTTNKDGFMGIENIEITANELITAAGINAADIKSGDKFNIRGRVTTTAGQTFTSANSSAAINGSSFRGFFNFTMNAFCPSNIEGTYSYVTTSSAISCSKEKEIAEDITGTVTIKALGDGVYNMDDWSFGAYAACYGAGTIADSDKLQFTDICEEVDFTGKEDKFGEVWSFTSSVEGNKWTITWENTFNEKGSTVITNDNGWDFVIVK